MGLISLLLIDEHNLVARSLLRRIRHVQISGGIKTMSKGPSIPDCIVRMTDVLPG